MTTEKLNISLLVGLKNNLEYTKQFYETTRALYPEVEICFVSYGSTDGTNEWLNKINDAYVKVYINNTSKTFAETFNTAAEIATKDYVAYLHNDIILTPNFCENLLKHHKNGSTVISYTTIEPPIFAGHNRPGKIIQDFGTELNNTNFKGITEFSLKQQQIDKDKTEPGITFFMCLSREVLINMGGLDPIFDPMFCEDDDLILRLKLKGMEMMTSLDSICYHYVSKTSRFSEEFKEQTRQIEYNSNRNFIRKWGFKHSRYNKVYEMAYKVKNCNLWLLENLEPWCTSIYVDIDSKSYIEKEQPKTNFPLNWKIYTISDKIAFSGILVDFDGSQLSQNSINILQNLPDIIYETNEIGKFQIDIFNIEINSLKSYENSMIDRNF
jgi:GT2 family glycosyltransferase